MRHYCCASYDPITGETDFLMVSVKPINRRFRVREQKHKFDPTTGTYSPDGPPTFKELVRFTFDTTDNAVRVAKDLRGVMERGTGRMVRWKDSAPSELRNIPLREEIGVD